jgi:starch synthase
MFLMPSQYEPCGLNQLYSLRYGAVPVVTATGGLKDTVVHASGDNLANNTATGFQIEEYSLDELTKVLASAVDMYGFNKDAWASIVDNGMKRDWSWSQSAKSYVELFERLRH